MTRGHIKHVRSRGADDWVALQHGHNQPLQAIAVLQHRWAPRDSFMPADLVVDGGVLAADDLVDEGRQVGALEGTDQIAQLMQHTSQ